MIQLTHHGLDRLPKRRAQYESSPTFPEVNTLGESFIGAVRLAHRLKHELERVTESDAMLCRANGESCSSDQYSRIATSKYHVRRISMTSQSAASRGGNAGNGVWLSTTRRIAASIAGTPLD